MRITAQFTQTPQEVRRYVFDYTLDLSTGETVTAAVVKGITTIAGQSDAAAPTVVVDDIAIEPGALMVEFYVSGGVPGGIYFVDFLVTTTAAQQIESILAFIISNFVPTLPTPPTLTTDDGSTDLTTDDGSTDLTADNSP